MRSDAIIFVEPFHSGKQAVAQIIADCAVRHGDFDEGLENKSMRELCGGGRLRFVHAASLPSAHAESMG